MNSGATDLNVLEGALKESFETGKVTRLPSNAQPPRASTRLDQLAVPDEQRGDMPLTQEKFVVNENVERVAWERETRKFLRRLNPDYAHRISAVMVYEWVTQINIAELVKAGGSANSELRHINWVLRQYFGTPYNTKIAGRKVPKAYKVPAGYRIKRRRPKTITLWVEWAEGTLLA